MPPVPCTNPCPPLDDSSLCGCLPAGFSRLRYFFGKRMAVADFVDEQRYHVGKRLLHNQYLHGAGVLCGLSARIFDTGSGTDASTVLRIGKGAAIDRCGREIIVGTDQCIDVDAWYRRRREEEEAFPGDLLDADGTLPLCVTLRYVECNASPEPAPRDPCSCATDGCEFGRVHESFALSLVPAGSAAGADPPPLHPGREALARALASPGPASIVETLGGAVMEGCHEPSGESELMLACFRARPSADLGAVDELLDLSATPILLSTAVLQELLLASLGALAPIVTGGPEITRISLADTGAGHELRLTLSAPIVGDTFDSAAVRLHRFDSTTGWSGPEAVAANYVDGPPPALAVGSAALVAGGPYRISIDSDTATPIVDAMMRPLLPRAFAWDFEIVDEGGVLRLAPAPYLA
jgi:hypothetical protein